MNEVQVFKNEQFGSVRTIEINDEPWFVASDIAKILEYRDAFNMVRILDDDEKDAHLVSTLGGNQKVSIISESGLYHAILGSKKPAAKDFRKWVTSEILPSIRKTGSFSINVPKTFSEALRLAADQQEQIEKQKLQLIEQQPKVEFADAIISDKKSTFDMAGVAQELHLPYGKNTLFSKLREYKILKSDNTPYQQYVTQGYFKVYPVPIQYNTRTVLTTKVTQSGVAFIHKILADHHEIFSQGMLEESEA